METSGVVPTTYPAVADLADLVEATARPGPFVTAVLDTTAEIDRASYRASVRWQDERRVLVEAGADEVALEAVDSVVPDAHLEGDALGVVADATGLVHVEHGPRVPSQELVRWAPLATVLPMIAWRQANPPHLLVLVDRTGADLVAYAGGRATAEETVKGDESVLRKVSAGGWSMRRYQNRAENTWTENAEAVAQEVLGAIGRHGARMVMAAGDQRALTLLRDSLPGPLADALRVGTGTRHADGSSDELDRERDAFVADLVARDTRAVLDKLAEEAGRGDRTAEGPEATLGALAMGQVAMLVLVDDPDDARTAWFGPEPSVVGTTRQALLDTGVEEPQEGRLVDVCARAALGTSADVRVLAPGDEGAPAGGVGAILRFALPAS